jgi:uncharacterized membrane protein YccC
MIASLIFGGVVGTIVGTAVGILIAKVFMDWRER